MGVDLRSAAGSWFDPMLVDSDYSGCLVWGFEVEIMEGLDHSVIGQRALN